MSITSSHFDRIIIGSSPICLLEAIYSNSRGLKTGIVDDATELGGAWKRLKSENEIFKNVEIGCHIFEKDKKVFDFLRKILHLQLKEMEPQPKVIFKNKPIPYNIKNFLFLFRNFKSYFTYKHNIKQLVYDLGIFLKEIYWFNLKYYNFQKESITFINKLIHEFNQRNISVMLSTQITSLNVNNPDKTIELQTAKGESIKTNKLTITYNSNLNKISIDGQDNTAILQRKNYEFKHLHLFIKDNKMKNISYWRIFNNEAIHRVSDMTRQIEAKEDEHLICIGIFNTFLQGKTEDVAIREIIILLKSMKLISDSCHIIQTSFNSYAGYYTDYYDLKHIETKTNNLIEVLYTLDITGGIKKNLFKYNTVQYSTN